MPAKSSLKHSAIDSRTLEVGRRIVLSVRPKPRLLRRNEEDIPLKLRELIRTIPGKGNIDRFKSKYRRLRLGTDEFVRTALMMKLLQVFANLSLTNIQREGIERIAGFISRIRVPTGMVGYSLIDEVMQHPTSKNTAFFENSGKREDPGRANEVRRAFSAHARHDEERKNSVVRAFEKAILNGKSAEEISFAGARATIEYSLNNMMAPIMAENVFPHSRIARGRSARKEDMFKQMAVRHQLKRVYIAVGGEAPDSEQSATAAWGDRRSGGAKRDLSPGRMRRKPSASTSASSGRPRRSARIRRREENQENLNDLKKRYDDMTNKQKSDLLESELKNLKASAEDAEFAESIIDLIL